VNTVREYFRKLKEGTEFLNYGRDIIASWVAEKTAAVPATVPMNVLDLGCSNGDDLLNVQRCLAEFHRNGKLFGIESYAPSVAVATERGIAVSCVDLERSRYPYADGTFDFIIANQIVEHTKEIFWMFSECSRILKHNGYLIVGVPNLASLHNRILLMLGDQPSSIELLGPHLRGVTKNGFVRFIEADGIFSVEEVRGANFYPFPIRINRILSHLFPTVSVSIFFLVRKVHPTKRFIDVLRTRFYETNYFNGQ